MRKEKKNRKGSDETSEGSDRKLVESGRKRREKRRIRMGREEKGI